MRLIPLEPAGGAQSGRGELAVELVQNLPRLQRYALRRVGPARADDVVQETLLRALEGAETFDRGRALFPWVRAIAGGVIARSAEREGRAPETVAEFELHADASCVALDPGELEPLLARLRAPERDALERFYLRGESVAAIAEATGAKTGTVKSRLARARGRLAFLLGSLGAAVAALAWLAARPTSAEIHSVSVGLETTTPPPPRFERVVLETLPSRGWKVTGARRIDGSLPYPETQPTEPR